MSYPIEQPPRGAVILGSPVVLGDSIALALELANALEGCNNLPDEDELKMAVGLMNHQLFGSRQNEHSFIKAEDIYALPSDKADIEFIAEEDIQIARIKNVIIKGKIDSFNWVGSVSLSGFGIRMFDVRFYEPGLHRIETAFVPLRSIEARIAA